MDKKTITGLIVLEVIIVTMFSGCAENHLESTDKAPPINNPEDAIKVFIYYLNNEEWEKAAKLLVSTSYGTALTKDEINKFKEKSRSSNSNSKTTYENLVISGVECYSQEELESCNVSYTVTVKSFATRKIGNSTRRTTVCIGTVNHSCYTIETEDGWKIVLVTGLDPWYIIGTPEIYSYELKSNSDNPEYVIISFWMYADQGDYEKAVDLLVHPDTLEPYTESEKSSLVSKMEMMWGKHGEYILDDLEVINKEKIEDDKYLITIKKYEIIYGDPIKIEFQNKNFTVVQINGKWRIAVPPV